MPSGSASVSVEKAVQARSRRANDARPVDEANTEDLMNLVHRVEVLGFACDDVVVPLSEEEQRILRQIEEELEQDPTFAQRGYRVSRRKSALLVAGLVIGLAVTVVCLAISFVAAFVAFLFVLFMAVKLESEVRVLGREQLGQLPISAWLNARRPDEQSDRVD